MKEKIVNVVKAALVGLFVIFFPVCAGVIAGIIKMESPSVIYLQAGFMFIPIIVILVFLLLNKVNEEDLFLVLNKNKKEYLYLLPALLIFIPVLVQGFKHVDALYLGGVFLLYFGVAIAEEVYFRGVIPYILKKEFSRTNVIIIATIIFGVGHAACAFQGQDIWLTILTIINAIIFGFMAMCLLYLHKSLYGIMLIHFIFDFETKIIALDGYGLAIAEGVRGTIMCLYAIALFIILKKKEPILE